MRDAPRLVGGLMLALAGLMTAGPAAATVHVVAAENFYGALARTIGGAHVEVFSVLSDPGVDAHLFEARPSTARRIADADVVIDNGLGYDDWMTHLLDVAGDSGARHVITAARVMHTPADANPHLWYAPELWPALARRIARVFSEVDPAHAGVYRANAADFVTRFAAVTKRIAALRAQTAGTPVTATEPVFGYMAAALGFRMENQAFQNAVMNDTEPSARQVAAFEQSLSDRRVRMLFYNRQVEGRTTAHLLSRAKQHNVPVVGVTETMPTDATPIGWLVSTLDAVGRAMDASS
nr:zinc ABC transporter substrate-binding protein [Salinisphaera sp. Q1T1-3]